MKKMYIDCCAHLHVFFFCKSDEWLESYDLKCINMYNLDGGVYIGKFFEFYTLIDIACKFSDQVGWVCLPQL